MFKKKKNKKLNANNISSFLILFYNLIIFMIHQEDPSNSQFQIILNYYKYHVLFNYLF